MGRPHEGPRGRVVGPLEKAESDVARLHAHGLWATLEKESDAAPFRRRKDRFVGGLGRRRARAAERALPPDARAPRGRGPLERPVGRPAVPRGVQGRPAASLEFETNLGDAPKNGKLGAIETLERTLGEGALEEELLQWMGR